MQAVVLGVTTFHAKRKACSVCEFKFGRQSEDAQTCTVVQRLPQQSINNPANLSIRERCLGRGTTFILIHVFRVQGKAALCHRF